MAEGVDYSWARPGGATLKNNGKVFAVRYLYDDGQGGKGLDASELADLHNNGIEVPVVYESYAGRAKEGHASGVADAQAAQAQLSAVGLPTGMPIYFAVDFDATPEDQTAIDDYLRGAATVIGLDRVGIYGGFYPVSRASQNGTAKWFWQTYAWSGGQWFQGNHIEQYSNGQNLNGAVDFVRSLQDNYGQPSKFGGATPPAPAPTPAPSSGYSVGETVVVINPVDVNGTHLLVSGDYTVMEVDNGGSRIVIGRDGQVTAAMPPQNLSPAGNTPTPQPVAALKVGDTVIITNPVDVNGTHLNVSGNYTVMEIDGSRVVVGRGGQVTAALDISHLQKVGGPSPTPGAQYVTVQAGWGLSNVAEAAGYADAGSQARWAAIAALNGSNNWEAFNAALKAGQSVRVA